MIKFHFNFKAETNSPHEGGLWHVLFKIFPILLMPITGTIIILYIGIITQVIIEILALSLAKNGVIFRFIKL